MISEFSHSFFSWALIFPTAFLVGSHFRRLIPIKDISLRGIFYFALGFAVISYSVVLLSVFWLVQPKWIWLVLVILFLSGIKSMHDLAEWLRSIFKILFRNDDSGFGLKILKAMFALSFAALFLGVLTPELGGDSLTYHLNLPKVFLMKGSIEPDYFDLNSYFPLFLNNLYVVGLATGGVISAKLFHFFCGLLLFFSILAVVFKLTGSEILTWFFSLVFWLTPTIFNMLSTAYNDAALTFYVFLALVALIRGIDQEERKLIFLSGLLLGIAVTIKYLAMVSFLGMTGIWIWELRRGLLFSLVKSFGTWMLAFAVGCAYWLIKNWFLVGNPFFPYFASVFGTVPYPTHYQAYGIGKGIFDFVSVFWTMVQTPTAFGSFDSRIGIFYFCFLPLVLIGSIKIKNARPYVLFVFFFMLGWFLVCQAHRYVMPVLPPIIVSAALGLQWCINNASKQMNLMIKRIGFALGLLGISVYLISDIYHYRYAYLLVSGRWSWDEFLVKMERTVPVAQWINERLPQEAKILVESEPRQFYIGRSIVRNVYLRYRTGYDKKEWDLGEFVSFLKERHITHILTTDQLEREPATTGPLKQLIKSDQVDKIYEAPSQNIRDEQYVYRLYALK